MTRGPSRPLTKRQKAVLERIDRRVPIKVIAQELGVSETRINQHIRALKDLYDAGNLNDLVEKYRAHRRASAQDDAQEVGETGDEQSAEEPANQTGKAEPKPEPEAKPSAPLSEAAYRYSQVPSGAFAFDTAGQDSAGLVEINDVLPLLERTPWLKPGEPKVVPGLLDGEHAVLFRLAAIVGIAFGFLAAIVLTLTAAVTISETLNGRAAVPVNEQGFS